VDCDVLFITSLPGYRKNISKEIKVIAKQKEKKIMMMTGKK
jgi:hypothetical protein